VICLSNYTSPDSISDRMAIEIAGVLLPGFAGNLQANGENTLTVGLQPATTLEGLRSWQMLLEGRSSGSLPTEETLHAAHTLSLALRLDGDRLTGSLTAESSGDLPHFGLPFLVSLSKQY
jgi:hypothetical protein